MFWKSSILLRSEILRFCKDRRGWKEAPARMFGCPRFLKFYSEETKETTVSRVRCEYGRGRDWRREQNYLLRRKVVKLYGKSDTVFFKQKKVIADTALVPVSALKPRFLYICSKFRVDWFISVEVFRDTGSEKLVSRRTALQSKTSTPGDSVPMNGSSPRIGFIFIHARKLRHSNFRWNWNTVKIFHKKKKKKDTLFSLGRSQRSVSRVTKRATTQVFKNWMQPLQESDLYSFLDYTREESFRSTRWTRKPKYYRLKIIHITKIIHTMFNIALFYSGWNTLLRY